MKILNIHINEFENLDKLIDAFFELESTKHLSVGKKDAIRHFKYLHKNIDPGNYRIFWYEERKGLFHLNEIITD